MRIAIHIKYNNHLNNGSKMGDHRKYEICLHPSSTNTCPKWWWYSTDEINIFCPNKPKDTNVHG